MKKNVKRANTTRVTHQQLMTEPLPRLKRGDFVVAAWAESAAGPGWSNTPVWFLVRDSFGKLRVECIQPHHHNNEITMLYRVSEIISAQMKAAVIRLCGQPERRR